MNYQSKIKRKPTKILFCFAKFRLFLRKILQKPHKKTILHKNNIIKKKYYVTHNTLYFQQNMPIFPNLSCRLCPSASYLYNPSKDAHNLETHQHALSKNFLLPQKKDFLHLLYKKKYLLWWR